MIAAALRIALTILAPTAAFAAWTGAVIAGHPGAAMAVAAFVVLALIVAVAVHEMRAADNPRRSVQLHHHR